MRGTQALIAAFLFVAVAGCSSPKGSVFRCDGEYLAFTSPETTRHPMKDVILSIKKSEVIVEGAGDMSGIYTVVSQTDTSITIKETLSEAVGGMFKRYTGELYLANRTGSPKDPNRHTEFHGMCAPATKLF